MLFMIFAWQVLYVCIVPNKEFLAIITVLPLWLVLYGIVLWLPTCKFALLEFRLENPINILDKFIKVK